MTFIEDVWAFERQRPFQDVVGYFRPDFPRITHVNTIMGCSEDIHPPLRRRVAEAISTWICVGQLNQTIPNLNFHLAYIFAWNMFGDPANNRPGTYRNIIHWMTTRTRVYADYLTSLYSLAKDGSLPDENYAREVMQLFTIGVFLLNDNGTKQVVDGQNVLAFDPRLDVQELAKVFVGVQPHWQFAIDGVNEYRRITGPIPDRIDPINAEGIAWRTNHSGYNSQGESLLPIPTDVWNDEITLFGETVPSPNFDLTDLGSLNSPEFLAAYPAFHTAWETWVHSVLNRLIEHPNTAPNISKNMTTALRKQGNNTYIVGAVTEAFRSGHATLPGGTVVGSGEYSDIEAVVAAALFTKDEPTIYSGPPLIKGGSKIDFERNIHFMRTLIKPLTVTTSWGADNWSLNANRPYSSSDNGKRRGEPYDADSVFGDADIPEGTVPGSTLSTLGGIAPELSSWDSELHFFNQQNMISQAINRLEYGDPDTTKIVMNVSGTIFETNIDHWLTLTDTEMRDAANREFMGNGADQRTLDQIDLQLNAWATNPDGSPTAEQVVLARIKATLKVVTESLSFVTVGANYA